MITYSDANALVPDSPDVIVIDETSVIQNIESIWQTQFFTMPFRRRVGSSGYNILFEPMTNSTAIRLQIAMKQDIELWEPRVQDIVINVTPNFEEQTYYVEASFTIPALNNKRIATTFNLDRPV